MKENVILITRGILAAGFVCFYNVNTYAGTSNGINKKLMSATLSFEEKAKSLITSNELKIGVMNHTGENTYQLGYPVQWDVDGSVEHGRFPLSELEFPADIKMLSGYYEVIIDRSWIITLNTKVDISTPNNDMIDRDWLTDLKPQQVDVYSNNKVDGFSTYEWGLSLKYKFIDYDNWSISAGAGYQYQKWSYETELIQQYSPSGLIGYDDEGNGTSNIKYELSYNIPYFSIEGKINLTKQLLINTAIAYSTWVNVENKDQHLFRGKINEGSLDGDYNMANIEVKYIFSSNWFISIGYEYKKIETKGNMQGVFISNPDFNHKIREKIKSTQSATNFMIGYKFK